MLEYSDRPLKEEYDKEPVFYCKKCLSLAIKRLHNILDYCDNCGSTEIDETDIHTWEKLYVNKYGVKFLNQK